MESIGPFLESLASLAWPVIIFFLLFKFSGAIKDVIQSARRRKFSIKVGENELTVEEASEQQRILINDLQEQGQANRSEDLSSASELLNGLLVKNQKRMTLF